MWSWYYSTPRGVRLKCHYAFVLVYCGSDTPHKVSVHIKCQASIYTLSLCRGYSWRVRLARQETLTPPGHLVSPLVCRGPWISIVVLYCWCHSNSASVLLYFTLILIYKPIIYKTKLLTDLKIFSCLGSIHGYIVLSSTSKNDISHALHAQSKIEKVPSVIENIVGKIMTSSGKWLVSTSRIYAYPKWDGTRCPME